MFGCLVKGVQGYVAIRIELYRIAEKVHQDLLNCARIGQDWLVIQAPLIQMKPRTRRSGKRFHRANEAGCHRR